MRALIAPGLLHGAVDAPLSKSMSHRLLIAAYLAGVGAPAVAENADVAATARCLRALNTGGGRLDCGESATTLRLLLPLCTLRGEWEIDASPALRRRPMAPLLRALARNGATIEAGWPMRVRGGLRAGVFSLPGDVSSQFFSGLLFALPLLSSNSALLFTSPLQSRPYVDMTLCVLRACGVCVVETPAGFRVPGGQRYRPCALANEGDWSAAAFWLAANALGSAVAVRGLKEDSAQGDRAVVSMLSAREVDVSQTPDLAPVLALCAAARQGECTITGGARLRGKESDRLATVAAAIRALGGEAAETPDGLAIRGCALRGGTVDGAGDHRVVMSAAVAATVCAGETVVTGAEAVEKSYPAFFEDFARLGGRVRVL